MPRGQRSNKHILNYSTEVAPLRSCGEIMAILAAKGALAINIEYENGEPSAMAFKIRHNDQEIPFKLPCNWRGVLEALQKNVTYRTRRRPDTPQAKRVAWRILKDYVEAQMAIVESNQAEIAEVFMGYAITRGGQTLFQRMMLDPSRLLSGGEESNVVNAKFGS